MLSNKLSHIAKSIQSGLRCISSSQCLMKVEDKKMMLRSMPAKDEGIQGIDSVDIDNVLAKPTLFPDENTPNQLFNGVSFKDLPICNIRTSPNNTIITVCDAKGRPHVIRSCGVEGFKNCRKGTNIAAQATAISIAGKALEKGFKTVRVTVRGLGPGRMSAIKGLTMGGLNIVSVTDTTPIPWTGPRPRKVRRL